MGANMQHEPVQNDSVTLETYLAEFSACKNPEQRQQSLIAGMKILSRPGETEPHLTRREIAAHYEKDPSTIWRWQLPTVPWHGQRRYLISQCDDYLISEAYKKRKLELKSERKRKGGLNA